MRDAISVIRVQFLSGSILTESSGKAGWNDTNFSGFPKAAHARLAFSLSSLSPLGSTIMTVSPQDGLADEIIKEARFTAARGAYNERMTLGML